MTAEQMAMDLAKRAIDCAAEMQRQRDGANARAAHLHHVFARACVLRAAVELDPTNTHAIAAAQRELFLALDALAARDAA